MSDTGRVRQLAGLYSCNLETWSVVGLYWAGLSLAASSLLLFSLCCLLLNVAWLLGVSVRWHPETETEAEH